jgi:hypothetical protein
MPIKCTPRNTYPQAPQLATDGVENDSEGVSFWKIKHGIRLTGMPSLGASLSDRQIGAWQTVRRDPDAEYRKAFGKVPGRVTGIAVMTEADNPGTKASGEYADIRFVCGAK